MAALEPPSGQRKRKGEAVIPRLAPMLASAKPLDREEGFVHEIKWDGYRVLAYIEEGQVDLVSRNGRSLAARFPELVPLLSSLPSQPLALDGEVLVLGEHGLPVFAALQGSGRGRTLAYAVFDVLYFSGENICPLPWLERRTKLTSLLSAAGRCFAANISRVCSWPAGHRQAIGIGRHRKQADRCTLPAWDAFGCLAQN